MAGKVTHWRQMTKVDIPAVLRVQEEAYPWHQEGVEVFEERLTLYPQGCLALDLGEGLVGYILSHPWHAEEPPPLDAALERLPERPGTYYLHDLALLRSAYGVGHGARVVRHLAQTAGTAGFETMSLVAVNRSAPFWRRHGFEERMTPILTEKVACYGDDAVFMTRTLL
jgi:ribosomal protein S18 acetylase RimI-like enzyme